MSGKIGAGEQLDPLSPTLGIPVRVRVWPAVLIVGIQIAVSAGFGMFASTAVQSVIGLAGAPLIAALGLIVWWFFGSGVPRRDRFAGLGLFIAALTGPVLAQKANGPILLVYLMPAMTIGIVMVLALTFWLGWGTRRWMGVGYMAVCAGVFLALRVDAVGGDLSPYVSWRWEQAAEDAADMLAAPEADGVAVLPEEAGAGDWPGFRGASRDNRVLGVSFRTDWNVPPRELWRKRVGLGWSSFAVVGNNIFTQEQRGGQELVICYAADTGEPIWVNSVETSREDGMGAGPRATPTFDGGRLYTQGATGIVQCLEAATGKTVWRRDVTQDAGAKVPTWGFSSSPLVAGALVVTFPGGKAGNSALAYHRETGEVAWRGGQETPVYSSPHFAVIGDTPQVLMTSDFGIESFEPASGVSLWTHPWKIKTTPRCVQPLLASNDLVMVGTTGSLGSRLLKIERTDSGGWTAKEEWTSRRLRPYFNDCVLHKGYCYGFDGDRLACIDIKTGDRRWDGKRYGGQVLLIESMDMLLVLSEAGEVILVPAAPDSFRELGQFKALTGKTWNHPVVAQGKLFVRNAEEAACYSLEAQ